MIRRSADCVRLAGIFAGLTGLSLSLGCLSPTLPPSLSVWVVSGDDELGRDTPPNPENAIYSAARHAVQLKAAINETLSLQVGLRTTAAPDGPYDLRVGDLVGPSATLASHDVTTVWRVHDTRVDTFRSWYPEHTGRPATPTPCPDALVPWDAPRGGGPLTLADPGSAAIWIDIHLPPTTAPGEYRGTLELRAARTGQTVFACELRIDVLAVALPDRRSLPVICRVDPRDLLTTHLRWPRLAAAETRLLPQVPSHLAAVHLVNETMQLLEEHRTNPVLWASFPKFRPAGDRSVEVTWDDYDRLVAGWLDGSAFRDRVPLDVWAIPADIDYPAAERNGGLDSPQYGRLLGGYLAACRQHFAARGWLDKAVWRPCPPEPLTADSVASVRRAAEIAAASETNVALMAHLPAESLRSLGWFEAPTIDISGVGVWAPPAMWYEPEAMQRARGQGQKTWLMPDCPPYSASLAVEAPATDARVLPWQAYRYGAAALWVEHAAEFGPDVPTATALRSWAGPGLLCSGEPFGIRDRPLPSVRLKRLCRGLQDYELLKLLEANGKSLLAHQLAEQIVRWACTAACLDNLVTCKESGWPRDPGILALARTLMLQELAGEFDPNPAARQQQIASLAQWGVLMTQRDRVSARIDGVRLTSQPRGLSATVLGSVLNATNRPLDGRWALVNPPTDWQLAAPVSMSLQPGVRRPARIDVALAGFAYNVDGAYPFELAFDSSALGEFRVPARLAAAACPPVTNAPVIDGRLADWPLAANNAAGDFRLCRASRLESAAAPDTPRLSTRAFFGLDDQNLYVAVRCELRVGEPPVWRADNAVPIDGTIPWSQDVVEILLDPRGTAAGTSSDLYCLQVKPTGLLIARKGCRTEPPMGHSEVWSCGARVAVDVQREAWSVEIALPLAALEPAARRQPLWGFNVTRLDARRGEYSSWSGARGDCYTPAAMGNLIMLWPQGETPADINTHRP
jgi:hypothetical protein